MPIDKLYMKIDITVDTQKSTSVEIPVLARTALMKVPAIDDGTLTFEMIDPSDITPAKLAPSSDTDWSPVYSDEGRTDVLGVGQDPAFVNITPYIGGFPQSGHMRVVTTVAQTANKTFVVYFRSH